jgi:hypothetical protein
VIKPDPDRAAYASYVLRLRWAWRDGQPVCQAMLTEVRSKERRCFLDLEALFAYLHAQGPQVEDERAQAPVGGETRHEDQGK